MIFEGEESFDHDINDVWAALHDIDLLTRAVPGCKSMTPLGNNSYAVALSLGVAAVRGDYDGKVKVIDVKAPAHYRLEGEGAGAPGFVKMDMTCLLDRQGTGTLMKWKCDATVGGLIASIGGKVLAGVSKFMAKQFFNTFKAEMKRRAASGSPTDNVSGVSSGSRGEGAGPTVHGASKGRLGRFVSSVRGRFSGQ